MDEKLKEQIRAKVNIRIPGLKKGLGAGDVVHKITEALGMEHCSECDQRQERMNRMLRFDAALKDADA